MIYLIGAPPRCGKTTLAKKLLGAQFLITAALLLLGAGCKTNAPELPSAQTPKILEPISVTSSTPTKNIPADPEKEIKTFLSRQDMRVIKITAGDINNNGITDYLVDGMPNDCGSCHSRPFYVFENGHVILEYHGDDYSIVSAKNGIIQVREPIRLDSEPYCCPSTYQITTIQCPNNNAKAFCVVKGTQPETTKQKP